MCGIGGAFGGTRAYDTAAVAKNIISTIQYRGPDGSGIEQFANGFFVHLRLSIIDTGSGGAQPKWTSDRRYCITYNGEIYNFKELREELIALGFMFTTQSDTEVLLSAWAAWGKSCVTKLIGMFAFALYDTQEHKLYLARDEYGIKPLYVTAVSDGVRFASTYPALACFPDCSRQVDPIRAFEFVRYGMLEQGGRTLVRGVRPVAPGSVEEWDVSGARAALLRSETLTRHAYNGERRSLTFSQAAEKLREAFLLSVRLHLRSDVPIGFALSGGIDSSAIVCAARILEPDADLKTFTYSAKERSRDGHDIDEGPWAKIVSDHVKALPHDVFLSGATAIGAIGEVVRTHGSPTASMSVQAQHAVFQAAHAANVKVMLDGQGGDELLAGYVNQFGAALKGLLTRNEYGKAARFVRSVAHLPRCNWLTPVGWALEEMLPESIRLFVRNIAGYEHQPGWINQSWLSDHSETSIGAMGPKPCLSGSDPLGDRLNYDLTYRIIPDLLVYEDRNSMQHSVESRVPFLARPIEDVAFSVPSEYHLGPDAISKRLFREAMRGILPESIRTRRDKIGFEPPQGDWLMKNSADIRRLLSSEAARSVKLFDHKAMLQCFDKITEFGSRDLIYVWRWAGLIAWSAAFQISWP